MSLSRLIARPLLAAGVVYGAQTALRNSSALAPKAARVTDRVVPAVRKAVPGAPIPTDTATLVKLNAGVQIGAALALATGRAPRLGAGVLVASLVPTTIAGHPFWSETDPAAKQTHTLQFFKNLSLIGGLIIAAGDTDGQPGVAYRARRVAKDTRREAKHQAKLIATAARQEARVAKAKVS